MSFGRITGVREVREGRLLISDTQARRQFVVDLERETKRQLGRQGEGPPPGMAWRAQRDLAPGSTWTSPRRERVVARRFRRHAGVRSVAIPSP